MRLNALAQVFLFGCFGIWIFCQLIDDEVDVGQFLSDFTIFWFQEVGGEKLPEGVVYKDEVPEVMWNAPNKNNSIHGK